jgi:hypothetical protein
LSNQTLLCGQIQLLRVLRMTTVLAFTSDDRTSSDSNRNLMFPVVIDVCLVVTWQFVFGWSLFSAIRVLGSVIPLTDISTLNRHNPLHTQTWPFLILLPGALAVKSAESSLLSVSRWHANRVLPGCSLPQNAPAPIRQFKILKKHRFCRYYINRLTWFTLHPKSATKTG